MRCTHEEWSARSLQMATCEHCGTEFAQTIPEDRFCCKGCEYVAELISEQGFEQFYDLKQGLAVAPVKSRPFEQHDFSWLAPMVAEAERAAIQKHGSAHLEMGLEGISCVGCVWLVEKVFVRYPGSIRAVASPSAGRLHLEWVANECDVLAYIRELCQFGYVASATVVHGDHERRRLAARLGLCGAFALNTMGFTLPVYLGMPEDFQFAALFRLVAFLSATLSMLVGSAYFIDRAWRTAKEGSLHIDIPIALGLIAAYVGSIVGWSLGHSKMMYFDFVSTFVFLMLGGRWLQTSAVDRNRRRVMRQQPVPEVVYAPDDENTPLPTASIIPGMKFRLDAGQALPVSSVLVDGEADFSLEWIHGEAHPVKFGAGSRLPGGAILLSRTDVVMEASEGWAEGLLAKLMNHGLAERCVPWLEKLLRIYLVVVLILGVSGLAIWGWRGDWITAMQAMISVFVVSCPCALGVAIPLADDLAASVMERLGVFVRSVTLWSRLRRIRQVIFDKTGTLTLERPVLDSTDGVLALSDSEALALARLTHGSLHPVSRALLEALGTRGQRLLREHGTLKVIEYPGRGVACDGWSLGKSGWTGDESSSGDGEKPATELRQAGELRATFGFHESLRPGSVKVVQELTRRGLSISILSGDHPEKVQRMAEALQIPTDQAHGGLSPEDKAARVRAIDCQDGLYLGDGANDSLAFDAAWVTGTPVVDRSLLESKADFFTLGAGLEFLPRLLEVAKARASAVQRAFGFALTYNIVVVAVAMTGRMSPLVAAVLMPLSSVVSILIVVRSFQTKFPNKD